MGLSKLFSIWFWGDLGVVLKGSTFVFNLVLGGFLGSFQMVQFCFQFGFDGNFGEDS